MHLHRVTPNAFDPFDDNARFLGTTSDDFKATALQFGSEPAFDVVATRFLRFGGGQHRQSDFEVYTEWKDVEKIIEKFCEARNSEALAIREAMKLAAAAKELGWRPPQIVLPQSN